MSIIKEIQSDLDNAALRVVTEYRNRLLIDALKLCGNETDAEDLIMRTFDAVFRAKDTFDASKGDFYPWLVGVMRRIWAKTDRRIVNQTTDPMDPAMISDLAGASNESIETILRNSDYDALREAISQLDPKFKRLIGLYYFDELSLKEIAAFFKTSPSTISRKLEVARKILAAKLSVKLGKKKPLAVLIGALLLGGVLYAAWEAGLGGWLLGSDDQSELPSAAESCNQANVEDHEAWETYRFFDDFKSKPSAALDAVAETVDFSPRQPKPVSLFSAPTQRANEVVPINVITNGGFEHTTASATTAGFVKHDADKFWHSCKVVDAVRGAWTEFNSSTDYQGAGFRKAGRDETGTWAAYLAALHQAKEGTTQRNQGVYIYCEVTLEQGNYFFEYWIKRKNPTTNKGFVNVDYQKKDDASVKGRIASGSLVSASAYTRVANPSFQIPESGTYRIIFSLWWDAANYEIPESPALAAYIDDIAMYRIADDVGGAIKVRGYPRNYGSADPSYGYVEFPKLGDEKILVAPSQVVEEKSKAHCVGYELRDMNGDFVMNENDQPITGAVNTVKLKFTTAMQNATLTWLFDSSNKVELAVSENGAVAGLREETPSCGWGWYGYDESITLEAMPKYQLLGWTGVPDWGVVDKTYTFNVVEPTVVTPIFAASNHDNLILNGGFEDCKGFRSGYTYSYNFWALNSGAWFGSRRVVNDYPSLGVFSEHLGLTPNEGDYAGYLYMSRLYEEVQSPGVCMWCRVSITTPGVYVFSCDFGSYYTEKVANQHPYVISATLIKGKTVTPQSEGILLVSREANTAQPASWESLENRKVEITETGDYVIKFWLSGWDTKAYDGFIGAGIDNVALKFRKGFGSGMVIMVH